MSIETVLNLLCLGWMLLAAVLTGWLARSLRRRGARWAQAGLPLALLFGLTSSPVMTPLATWIPSGWLLIMIGRHLTEEPALLSAWLLPSMLATSAVAAVLLWWYFRRGR